MTDTRPERIAEIRARVERRKAESYLVTDNDEPTYAESEDLLAKIDEIAAYAEECGCQYCLALPTGENGG